MAKYWVGGAATTNWNEATGGVTNWGSASGVRDNAAVPGATDDVIFDNSVNGNSPCTINVNVNFKSFDASAYVNTITFNVNLYMSPNSNGAITFGAGMTFTLNGGNLINSGTGFTLTTNGILMPSLQAAGATITLGDDLRFADSKTTAVTLASNTNGRINLNGHTISGFSATSRVLFKSDVVGSYRNITVSGGAFANADFQDISFTTGGVDLDLSAITGGSGDCGGNSNSTAGKTVKFTDSTVQNCTMSVNKDWSDVTIWTSRVPLPQDDVTFTGVTGGQLATNGMPRLGRNIDWSGATGTPTWAQNITSSLIFGSITLISGMTMSGSNGFTLSGRGSHQITSNGKQFSQPITINAPGGTYTLNDALSTAGALTYSNGNFNAGAYSITCLNFVVNGTTARTLTSSGLWTITTTATANIWNMAAATNVSLVGTPSITISGASSNIRTFIGGAYAYGILTYNIAGSTGKLTITGSNSFDAINFFDASNARTLEFTANTTTTIRSADGFNVFGTSGKQITIQSATAATHTLSSSLEQTKGDYLNITNSIATGGGVWFAGPLTNSTDSGGNTGWVFDVATTTSTSTSSSTTSSTSTSTTSTSSSTSTTSTSSSTTSSTSTSTTSTSSSTTISTSTTSTSSSTSTTTSTSTSSSTTSSTSTTSTSSSTSSSTTTSTSTTITWPYSFAVDRKNE